jgi:hypothetical protein
VLAFTCAQAHAQTLDFDFTVNLSSGSNPNPVTGEIFGLQNNATSLPTSVTFGEYNLTDVSSSGEGLTVTNDSITSGDIEARFTGTPYLYLQLEEGQLTYAVNDEGGSYPFNFSQTALVASSAPEPKTWALLLAGLALMSVRPFRRHYLSSK